MFLVIPKVSRVNSHPLLVTIDSLQSAWEENLIYNYVIFKVRVFIKLYRIYA